MLLYSLSCMQLQKAVPQKPHLCARMRRTGLGGREGGQGYFFEGNLESDKQQCPNFSLYCLCLVRQVFNIDCGER